LVPTTKTRRTLKKLRKLIPPVRYDSDAVNLYGIKLVREWYRLYWGDFYDLHPVKIGQGPAWDTDEGEWDAMGNQLRPASQEPKWFPWWLSDLDLREALGISYGDGDCFEYDHEWHEPWRQWALQNGIAPGQPFCVAHPEPEVSKTGWETVEYDVHYASYVIEIQELKPAEVLRRWEHDRRRTSVARALDVAAAKANAERVNKDLGNLYIYQGLYQTGSSSMSFPEGRLLRIETKLQLHPRDRCVVGAEGRDDKGKFEVAMERLIEDACARNPYLSPEVVKSLELRK
jgi:hypothetical protein